MSYPYPTVSVNDIDVIVAVNKGPTVYVTVRGPPTLQAQIGATTGATNGNLLRVLRVKQPFRTALRAALVGVGITHFPIFHKRHRIRLIVEFGVSDATKDVQLMMNYLSDVLRGVLYRNHIMISDLRGIKVHVEIGEEYTQFSVEKW